ncbi:MAG TPA: hypothetical protein ENK06_10625 [Gammaproteobacteria bacterium]|nr:hypothetical protein [Gammaproteobacteria bacterium]
MTDNQLDNIKTLQESQKNIKIWIGTIIGVIFLIFFFTFAMLVDKFPPIFFIIESIITLILFPCLFILNRISFAILKLKKGRKPAYKSLIKNLSRDDVDKKPEEVLEKISRQ